MLSATVTTVNMEYASRLCIWFIVLKLHKQLLTFIQYILIRMKIPPLISTYYTIVQ